MSTPNALRAAVGAPPAKTVEPRNDFERLEAQLMASRDKFLPLLGNSEANVAEFIRVVLNAAVANPALVTADRRSFLTSCMKAALDGLMPDGRECVLNIYSTKVKEGNTEKWIDAVQYLPMVGGLIKLLYLSGEVTLVDAAVVYQAELDEGKFRWVRGDKPRLEHEPTGSDNPGALYAAYCCITLKNGEVKREVMFRRDIAKVKAASKSTGHSSPWVKWEDQQWIKSVVKRAYKQVPHTERANRANEHDNEAMGYVDMATTSLGEITARTYSAAPPAGPAITHQPVDPMMDFGGGNLDEREPVGARTETQQQQGQQQGQQRRSDAPHFDPEAFSARIGRCNTEDGLDILADDLREVHDPAVRTRLDGQLEARRAQLAGGGQPAQPAAGARVARRSATPVTMD